MGKLHDQMRDDLLLKACSPHTLKTYLNCVRHFVRHYIRSPQEMGEQEVRDFLLPSSLADGKVTFRARDNSRPGQQRLVTTTAQEFIRRFLLHILPYRFVKIRHFGLMPLPMPKPNWKKPEPSSVGQSPFLKMNSKTTIPMHTGGQNLAGDDAGSHRRGFHRLSTMRPGQVDPFHAKQW